jgi:signal transduction histidine kinase/CheY-like chemotaxis protein
MIIDASLFIATELIPMFSLKYGSSSFVVQASWKIHWVFGILFLWLFFDYCLIMIKKPQINNVLKLMFSDLLFKVSSVLFIIFELVYLFLLEYSDLNLNNMNYLPGNAALIVIGFAMLIIIVILICLFKNKTTTNSQEKKTIIIVILILIGSILLQILFKDISVGPIGFCLLMYSLYFNYENPDLAIINEISNAQGDIEKSNQTKTDFLSNMTYEIKVPMNLISSLCDELVNMSTFDEKLVRDDIEQIQTSGNNLLDIINNILDVSKIESGKDVLQEREYPINDMLVNIINIAKSKIGAKPIKLAVNIDQNVSSVLYGDSAKLYQSLINIMGNAVKYTEVGRITFTLTSTKSSGIEHLQFKISDTGTGIKEEDQDKLFSKFTRLDNAVENEIEGSGLGLVITKQYIESMGGKIWYETQYRVGTTFYIEVPQKIVDTTTLGVAAAAVKTETSNEKIDCSKYTALIVDDNNLNIKVAKRLLEAYKFNIESVTTGKDCVYKIKEGDVYDIIFMDHMMPEMDGIETLHVLKKLDGYKLPPIVALTANAIAGMKEMYLSEGFDDYLSKPINTNELDRIVHKFFNK